MKGMGTPSSSNMMERMGQPSYGNGIRQTMTTRSRCLPPMVAAKLAQNAPIKRARKVQYIECATALRAVSEAWIALAKVFAPDSLCRPPGYFLRAGRSEKSGLPHRGAEHHPGPSLAEWCAAVNPRDIHWDQRRYGKTRRRSPLLLRSCRAHFFLLMRLPMPKTPR